MRRSECAFVRIGTFSYAAARIKSLLPETEVSRYLQASFCDLVHLKNRFLLTQQKLLFVTLYTLKTDF